MKLALTRTRLNGVVVIDPEVFSDSRGFFFETWNVRDFAAQGLPTDFVQDSHSRSTRGVLRGLHFQDATAPMGQLVRCSIGAIFDVAVDLREASPTFGSWFGVDLTAANKRQIYIPPGFAHGFQAVSEVAEVQYKQTGFYTPSAERVVRWNDPAIGIAWPLPDPILNPCDAGAPQLNECLRDAGFPYR